MAPAAGPRAASRQCWAMTIRSSHISRTPWSPAPDLCSESMTRFVVEHGKAAIEWLIQQGVQFSHDELHVEELHLTREGGHSHRRIVHAADATGAAVQLTLSAANQGSPQYHPAGRAHRHRPHHRQKTGARNRAGQSLLRAVRARQPVRQGHHHCRPDMSRWPRAAQARFISTPPIPTSRRATASPWAGAPVAGSPTWNSSSFTPPACTTRTPSPS